MSKGINPVAQTYYEVTNIRHEVVKQPLDYSDLILTWLPDSISNKGKTSISLLELKKRLNSYKRHEAKGKINNSGFLKGLYTGYFVGENCTTSAPYLCFDIDVKNNDKKKENIHLFNAVNNDKVFKALEKIAVICWRSNSQNGIAGILFIPKIAQYTNETRELHKTVGESITNYLSNLLHEITGVKIEFDPAQSKFRQVRLIAEQTQARELNSHPVKFTYEVEKRIKQTSKGVIKYRDKNYKQPNGSISAQFDSNTPIFEVMLKYGFTDADIDKIKVTDTNKKRVKHHFSDSSSTGVIDTNLNVYFNWSESLGGTTSFTPARIVCKFEFDNNWKLFKEHLYKLNYKDQVTTPTELKNVSNSLKDELQNISNVEADKVIFKHCFDLQNATNEVKKQFIADNCINPDHKKYFIEYLKLADYQIKYDKLFIIDKYVSETLHEVLNYADQHNKIVLRAETGKGKTTAFVKDFHKHRPNARLLILAPLTIIVEQNAKDYKGKGAFLTGKSNMPEKIEALKEKIVFATYEQGVKLLTEVHTFDYIVIDEIHQLLTANSFKRDVIAELTPLLNNCKLIGLTGTPTQIFKKLDFKLLDIDVKKPIQTDIEVRFLNIKAFDIVINHLSQKPTGKVLIRLNEIETIKVLIKHLVSIGLYKKSECLFLHSTKEIKNSKEYKKLAHKREFYDNYKLIFTTSLIDEGLSIEQIGFSDVVFIETNYNPRPEPVKQFFARFRNVETERKNYLYLRTKENQTPTRFNPEIMFDNDLLTLENERAQIDAKEVLTTYNSLFSNNNFYYNNATVNPYYLGYAVTQVLFSYFNTAQFLEYLESNYNLSFTINKTFEVHKIKAVETSYTKELKQQIALFWVNENEQILQILYYHTQNPRIRKATHPTQTRIEPEILEFVTSNIKHFEQLFNRTKELTKLGVNNPLECLIKSDVSPITLQSNDFYNKEVLYYRIENTLNDPITQADKKTANQFISFAKWCKEKQTFSYNQMIQRLKEIGVMNYKAFNEQMLFELLKGFELNTKRNKKTNLINCTGLQGST